MWLNKAIPNLRDAKPRVTTTYGSAKQMRIFIFPPLGECRKAFGKLVNQDIPSDFWDGKQEWMGGSQTPNVVAIENVEKRQRSSAPPVPAHVDAFMKEKEKRFSSAV